MVRFHIWLLAAACAFEADAGSWRYLQMKRYEGNSGNQGCIGFDRIASGQAAKLFGCDDGQARRFRHQISNMRLQLENTNLCLDDWGTDREIRLNTCSGSGGQRDQMWLPMAADGGYAFYNLANDCVLDDWGDEPDCESIPNSLNTLDFATSQIFINLGDDFID